MMAITAHSPKYNADGTIDLIVKFPWLDVEVPFCANPADVEHHSADLFARAAAGQFGPIAPYIAPAKTQVQIDAEARKAEDDAELAEVKAMPFVTFLATKSPAKIANRITNDIAADGVEAVLVRMAKVLGVLAKDKFR